MRRVSIIALLLFVPSVAVGQDLYEPAPRQGYYLGGGFRSGVLAGDSEDVGSLGIFQGGGFQLRFGQMSNDWIGFGLLVDSGGGSSSDWSGGFGALSLEVQVKPITDQDLSLRLGVGVGGLGLSRVDPALETDDDPSGTAGTLYTFTLGYDWFPFHDPGDGSGGFAIAPFFSAQVLPGSNLILGGLFVGVDFVYWFGLPKNKLDLSPEDAFVKEDS